MTAIDATFMQIEAVGARYRNRRPSLSATSPVGTISGMTSDPATTGLAQEAHQGTSAMVRRL